MKKLLNMIERRHPLSAVTQITSQEPPKHVHLMTARASTLKIKQHMIERGHPLFAVRKVTRTVPPKHVPLMKGRTSKLKPKQIMTERGHPLFAVTQVTQGHEQSMLNEVNIDFRIPGLPHSVVKQAQNSRVRELVKKIEKHPHRQFLQRDPQQNKAYNPFSSTSKKMIQDVGKRRAFLNCSRRTLRRNVKNAYHVGVKVSSTAHAGIS